MNFRLSFLLSPIEHHILSKNRRCARQSDLRKREYTEDESQYLGADLGRTCFTHVLAIIRCSSLFVKNFVKNNCFGFKHVSCFIIYFELPSIFFTQNFQNKTNIWVKWRGDIGSKRALWNSRKNLLPRTNCNKAGQNSFFFLKYQTNLSWKKWRFEK